MEKVNGEKSSEEGSEIAEIKKEVEKETPEPIATPTPTQISTPTPTPEKVEDKVEAEKQSIGVLHDTALFRNELLLRLDYLNHTFNKIASALVDEEEQK